MGVIQRQTLKNNIVSYLAVVIGALAQVFLYSKNLDIKGQADALYKIAVLLGPFAGFGMQMVMVRFVPYLDDDRNEASALLLTRSLLIVSINVILLSLINWIWGDVIIHVLADWGFDLALRSRERWYVLLLLAPVMYSVVFTAHALNHHRIAIPAIFNSLLVKLLLPISFALVVFNYIPESAFLGIYISIYWIVLLALVGYVWFLGALKLRWGTLKLKDKQVSDMISLGVFSFLTGIGSSLTTHLDTIFVKALIDEAHEGTKTGIYSFAIFTTTVIAIPFRAVNSIASPIVAKAWQEGNFRELRMLYRETASVLLAAGGYVFSGIVVCLPFVYQLSVDANAYAIGFSATVFLGIGQLVDQMTSINSTLITYTDNYRWNIVFVLFLGGLNIVFNSMFIVTFDLGLTGAALATMLSLILYNLAKGILIQVKMNMQPLSLRMLGTIGVILLACFCGTYLPQIGRPLIDIVVRGVIVSAIFYVYIRFTNGVPALKVLLKEGPMKMFSGK